MPRIIAKQQMGKDVKFFTFYTFYNNMLYRFQELLSGYFVATYKIDEIVPGKGKPDMKTWFYKYYDIMEIEINKKFDTETGIPLKLYHVTHRKNLKKIQNKGLLPLSYKKIDYHPDRIYLFGSLKSAKIFKSDLMNRYFLENKNLVVLEINSKLLNEIKRN